MSLYKVSESRVYVCGRKGQFQTKNTLWVLKELNTFLIPFVPIQIKIGINHHKFSNLASELRKKLFPYFQHFQQIFHT